MPTCLPGLRFSRCDFASYESEFLEPQSRFFLAYVRFTNNVCPWHRPNRVRTNYLNFVIPSEESSSVPAQARKKERETPRFARNDKRMGHFFRSLFSPRSLILARTNPRRLKSLCDNGQIFVGHGFSRAVTRRLSTALQAAEKVAQALCLCAFCDRSLWWMR
jgi:hypothetical protein